MSLPSSIRKRTTEGHRSSKRSSRRSKRNTGNSEGNTFTIETEGRSYNLRAENQNIKNDWIEKIKYCFTHLKKGALRHNSSSFDSSLIKVLILKGDEKEKINDISQKLLNIINKNGYILNIQFEDSKQYLEKYRINKLINLNDKKMLTHIHFGFMHKKQKFHDSFNFLL